MSTVNQPDDIERQLAAADPGRSVTETELAASRARSLIVMESADGAGVGSVSRISEQTRPHTALRATPPRLRRRVLLASAAAALLVGGVVVAEVVRPGGPGATAEAAEVLNNAAEATIRTSDPEVGPGQYLKIETRALTSGGMQAADGSDISWQEIVNDQLYVPADKEGEWVWDRGERVPVESDDEVANAAAAELAKFRAEGPSPAVGIQRAPGGAFYGNGPMVIIGSPLQEAGSLPKDPQELLEIGRASCRERVF